MRTAIVKLAFVGLCVSGAPLACTADIHDNTADVHDNNANINDAEVEMTTDVDMDNVHPAESVKLEIVAQDVFLIDPSETPPSDRVEVAGHFQIYLDSTSGQPLLITAQESVSVTLPADVAAGDHKLICRVHKHDGTPTSATSEIDIKVNVSVQQ